MPELMVALARQLDPPNVLLVVVVLTFVLDRLLLVLHKLALAARAWLLVFFEAQAGLRAARDDTEAIQDETGAARRPNTAR